MDTPEKIKNTRLKSLNLYEDEESIANIASALSVPARRNILKLINMSNYSINEIAEKLNMPVSTASFHVKVLVNAGLLNYSNVTKKIGNEKRLTLNNYLFTIYTGQPDEKAFQKNEKVTIDIPIGSYTNYSIDETPCGITTAENILLVSDYPCIFSSPQRFKAGLIWLKKGFLEYSVPLLNFSGSSVGKNKAIYFNDLKSITSLCFSFEICSEYAGYNHNYKSDITFSVNGIDLCTYTSLGDFGERRGKLTPEWWADTNTQYGLLQNVDIRFDGTYLNEKRVSDVCVEDLNVTSNDVLIFRISVKDDAKHVGGFNLFGKEFGDYPQDVNLTITYQQQTKKIEI